MHDDCFMNEEYEMIRITDLLYSSLLFSVSCIGMHSPMDDTILAQLKTEDVSIVDSKETKNSYISYVTINETNYLIKQKKTLSKQFLVVRDALAAWIADDLQIAHSVYIIPSKQELPGKKNMLLPAVLLTVAPGKMIRSQPYSKYYKLSLKQRNIDGLFSPDRWFTETIVHQMTWHPQLPIIIALDLFICNTDRHGGNLFYDQPSDAFCAIDMDNLFRRDLPAIAVAKLNIMRAHKKKFTREEIEALTIVKETVQYLMKKYSVEEIVEKLYFFVDQADFMKDDPEFMAKVAKKLARHKKTIMESRASLSVLISVLDKIIADFNQSA